MLAKTHSLNTEKTNTGILHIVFSEAIALPKIISSYHYVFTIIFFLIASTAAHSIESAPTLSSVHLLSTEEKQWLVDNPVIVHGVFSGHAPFEYVNEQGHHRGLTSEYVKILSNQLNIEFKRVPVKDFGELIEKMRAGEIQTASYYLGPSVQGMHYSKPMIKVPIVLFGRQGYSSISSISEIVNEELAVETPSRASEILNRDYPSLPVTTVDSPVEGMKLVQSGNADLFMHNVFSIEYFQRKYDLSPLKVVSLTPYEFDIRFAANTKTSPLIPIAEKVFDGLTTRERRLIFDKWVNVEHEGKLDIEELLTYGAVTLLIVFTAISLVLYWNKRLRHQVDIRTREIEMSKVELRSLARHMEHVREEEKARLAREIHDDLGHTLTALTMGVRQLTYILRSTEHDGNAEKIKIQLSEIKSLIKDASETSRGIMSDLRPSVLEDFGLTAALEWLAHEFESHHHIECRFQSTFNDMDLQSEAAITLFRIAQESLTNVAKHANATFVTVSVTKDDSLLYLKIEDNGVGLQPEWNLKSESYGIIGIKERAIAFDGSLEVKNNQHAGMYLQVSFPIHRIHETTTYSSPS